MSSPDHNYTDAAIARAANCVWLLAALLLIDVPLHLLGLS